MNKDDYEIRNVVKDRLILCRRESGLTQEQLSKIIGKPPTTISSWERGQSLPSIQMLYQLSQYYDKSIGYMYGESDE